MLGQIFTTGTGPLKTAKTLCAVNSACCSAADEPPCLLMPKARWMSCSASDVRQDQRQEGEPCAIQDHTC